MNILFPPRSASCRNRTSIDSKSSHKTFVFRDKQLRAMQQEKNSHLLLNKSYIHKPEVHLPQNDSKEVSLQLHVLKKNFDKACSQFTRQDSFIAGLKTQLEKISEIEVKKTGNLAARVLEVQNLEDLIEKTKKNQEIEEDNRHIFLHVLDRMRTTLVHLKQRARDYKITLHKNDFLLSVEHENFSRGKHSRAKTANAMERLKGVIEFERNQELREVNELEKNVEKRKLASNNRTERRKRQAEVIEKAIIDSQSSRLEEMKEQFYLNRLWYHMVSHRHQKEQSSSKRFENAYKKIKLSTGISEIPLFVIKFLTREKDYRETLDNVKTKELELNEYKEKIAAMQEEIERFQTVTGEIKVDLKGKTPLAKLHREIKELNQKKTAMLLVQDRIKKWAQKMRNKVQVNCLDSIFETGVGGEPQVLKHWFEDISEGVKFLLRKVDFSKVNNSGHRENLKEIVGEAPRNVRSFRKLQTPVEMNELLGVETEVFDEFVRRPSRKF